MSFAIPNDILLLVGEFVEDHQDRYNLVFVSRHFHDLFLRLVYQHATLKNCAHIRSFLGAILRRPELARAVRTLAFDQWQSNSRAAPTISEEDLALFRNWVQAASQSEEEVVQWEQDLINGVEEAWIALLLPLVSNLKQLRLVHPQQNRYLDRTMQRAVKKEKPFHTKPAFRSLQEVSLSLLEKEEDDSKDSYLPVQVLPFFQFPSMRVISADSLIDPTSAQADEPVHPLPGFSSISEINLTSSNGSKGMESLIASCSSLNSFKYQHSDFHLLAEGFQPSVFYRSLARSKHSLQTLWLDSYGTHLPFTIAGANQTHDEWFGSLVDFTALKDIRIRLPNLLDIRYQTEPSIPLTEILPQSVESLYIEGCKENSPAMLIAQLKMVLSKRQTRFTSLKRLDIEGFFHDEEDYENSGYDGNDTVKERVIKPQVYETTEPLRSACADAGVQLFIRDRECLESI